MSFAAYARRTIPVAHTPSPFPKAFDPTRDFKAGMRVYTRIDNLPERGGTFLRYEDNHRVYVVEVMDPGPYEAIFFQGEVTLEPQTDSVDDGFWDTIAEEENA